MDSVLENNKDILRNYIIHPKISIHNPDPEIILRTPNIESLYSLPSCPASTNLAPKRDFITGEILDFVEVEIQNAGATVNSSMSMKRAPGPPEEATRGSAMNFPFWPGGFEEPAKKIDDLNIELDLKDLLSIPPGFKNGLEFESKQNPSIDKIQTEVNLLEALENENEIKEWLEINEKPEEKEEPYTENVEDILLTKENSAPVLEISKAPTTRVYKKEWAEMMDTSQPVSDFNIKIPEPAFIYPFELDTFQKQAIIKLEERQHVFVAAHTSAGKTAVAEYAIALSQKHMTRSIYTSPIKALSNQKYRDFKKTFKDVGLITGDYQCNPTASCLIMTTEILRSMLCYGSDCTRDLEYVIFDEVHYINDFDRGHVWEEIIILLPDHVSIIMLSATVPNSLEFADWVGNTKKRKVYVIITQKRPVPLMHHLYTECNRKPKLSLIIDNKGNFLTSSFKDAMKSLDKKDHWGPKEDNTFLKGLVTYLKKTNQLPVVAFTFSRKRCDRNAAALNSLTLNNNLEKSAVKEFVRESLKNLKQSDQNLPQVLSMKESLERGIGVHHSGILPILKEIVELLFEKTLVKLLFATETFAMGVNMPAKTVVFDSYTKHDGKCFRILKPAEYIQMAGRAGRRGHDETGTVIILCKKEIKEEVEFRRMILGQPEELQSKFFLRYAMILTCLRIEDIKVENMIVQSFKEFDKKLSIPEHEKELKILREKKSTLGNLPTALLPLCKFVEIGREYIQHKQKIIKVLIPQKELKPGRVLIVSQKKHYNKLGIILCLNSQFWKETTLDVLVLDHVNSANNEETTSITSDLEQNEMFYRLIALAPQSQYFYPEGMGGYTVLEIKLTDIIDVTKTVLKIDAKVILQNWNQRNNKNNPLELEIVKAVTDLKMMNDAYIANRNSVQILKMSQEINIAGQTELIDIFERFNQLEKELKEILPSTNVANFEQDFSEVFRIKSVDDQIITLESKISPRFFQLHEEYDKKLKVLRCLGYIDDYDEVTLKGKVACAIGQNELILTELIVCNFFNDLDAAKIAALLSSLVFQSKTQCEDDVEVKKLEKELNIDELKEIDNKIQNAEREHEVTSEVNERLNFGLVRVVYEWARKKPFSTIMKLTDIEEGIIVRCIQQLDEILRDVKTAARVIGNPTLQSKMEEASEAIKRDIVFTPSLYTK